MDSISFSFSSVNVLNENHTHIARNAENCMYTASRGNWVHNRILIEMCSNEANELSKTDYIGIRLLLYIVALWRVYVCGA